MTKPPTIFTWPARVYWEDTDAGGIIYYANYLKFLERARTEWLRMRGVNQMEIKERTGAMFIVTECNARYLASARLDDEILISAQIIRAGKASLELEQDVLLRTDLKPLLKAQIKVGWVDAKSMRPVRMPDEILLKLNT